MHFGLINLCKPSGVSSRAALTPIERQFRPAKVGHAGTLDPLATGVLAVLVGPATRLADHIQTWPKTYEGTFLLGRASDTEDIEGVIVEETSPVIPSRAALDDAAAKMVGRISQRPPAYSALHVQGRRAYALARAGKAVDLSPRLIQVHALAVTRYEYPEVDLKISCGSGTYVRSLGRDLAEAVGTTAVMSALTRTAIGHLTLDTSVPWELIRESRAEVFLRSARDAVGDLPSVNLSASDCQYVWRGHRIECPGHDTPFLAGLTMDGQLASLLTRQPDGSYGPQKNFPPEMVASR